ncbi:MAG: nicotinate-nucleotide--dimethylbenzimidazole phosphoribosyltransferase [Moorea sp. SIO2I5]|nr:nicotinate-nucleotide--dimethylbenzimidazole phosphoribosyltransferase [Moorena sp. SIO2I5]
MIRVYTQQVKGKRWLQQYQGCSPVFACILGFTATGLIPGISAAGATPDDRQYTAIADAEFLVNGVTPQPQYPLPPLTVGVSPVLISRAVVEAFNLPIYLFNAGLPHPPTVPAIDLAGIPAKCLTSGNALPLEIVKRLFQQGLQWGEKLASVVGDSYLIISECVVGGTTTALSLLTALGIDAAGKVNSSHPQCNHDQKWEVVKLGLQRAGLGGRGTGELPESESRKKNSPSHPHHPAPVYSLTPSPLDHLKLVAAVGDPMQIAAAGMAMAASRRCGVLLAGGTQMLAVYTLAQALAESGLAYPSIIEGNSLAWQPAQVVVGTTRWVAEDSTGDTVGLAKDIGSVPLLATQLSFSQSRYSQLHAYEQGYVKEGVGAGGSAIAAHLYKGWNSAELLQAIENVVEQYRLSLR